MASKGKKISELTELTSASLQTTLVGVDNGTTYKVTLDVLEDAIISMVSRSTDLRLDSLEAYTSSVGAEIDLTPLNSFTSSQSTLNSAFTTGINARLQTSSFNDFSASVHSEILAATNEQDLSGYVTQLVVNTLSGSVDGRIDSLEENSSSYETKGSGILSGSVSYTSLTDIPTGIVSQSVDIADFVFTADTITNSDVTIVATDGDIVLNADGNVYVGSSNAGNGIVTNQYFDSVVGDINRINNGTGYSITDNLDNVINSIPSISSLNTFTSSQEILNNTFTTTGSNSFNGNQTINGSLTIATPSAGVPNSVSNWNGGGGWNQGFYSNLFTSGGTGTGLTVDITTEGSGYIDINSITINTPGIGYTNGDIITINNENNLPGEFTIGVEQGSGWVFNTSGSLTTPGDVNISGSIYANNLDGLISSSAQITQFGFISASNDQNLSTTSSVQFHDLTIAGTGSFESDVTIYGNLQVWGTQSVINSTNVELSDNILYLAPSGGGDFDLGIVGHYNDGTYSHTGIFSDASDGHAWKVFKGLTTETTGAYVDTNGVGYTLADFKANNIYGGIYATNGVISGSSQLTSSYDSRYTLSGSVSAVPSGTISGSSQITGIVNLTNLSATSQISASVFVGGFGVAEAKYTVISAKPMTFYPNPSIESVRFTTAGAVLIGGNHSENNFKLSVTGSARIIGLTNITGSLVVSDGITGSIAATNGIISGSSQLTASYDTRYTLSGSVVSGTTPAGTISGSSQLTSSFDGRYTQTGSFNTLTASFNSFTSSAQSVTTGSNSFNGTQTITGSLIITTGSFVASQITANTASLYLTSGSNLYVQNNGVVEITGSLKVKGTTTFETVGGDEGGEIQFGIPATNTTLENRVATDIFQNRYRIFEGSSNAKGVYIDLAKAPNGVGGELMWKASGFVNTDVDVTLGNLKARIPSSGNKSLQVSTISGTYSVHGSSTYSYNGIGGITLSSPLSITTTPTYISAGYNFTVAGSTDTWILMDTSAGICWRVTMIIGPSYLNNFISIERLH